ncbi:MAG TPA: universal stress protein [Steroidobacteraceae bacterium]|nr:universal stress protein [Steroidobacteraceae bacterium]
MASPIRTVVAASDFSFSAHRAARRAGVLAKEHGASLHLLHVIDSSPVQALMRRSPALDVDSPLRLDAERALAALAADIVAAGGVVNDRLLREGRVMDEILAVAASSDLMVLGPRGVNPIRDFIIGSTAERMARRVECPLLVAKQDPQIPYENVLVPVDFSDYSAPALRFAAAVAPDATLHVLHALDSALIGSLRSAGVSDEGIAAYSDELQRAANAEMVELTAGLSGRAVFKTVETGDARVLIKERAAASRCTLIVMGKQGRSLLSEHILGSVTRLVLERATCDVAVVPHR